MSKPVPEDDIQTLRTRAQSLLDMRQHTEALQLYEQVCASDNPSADDHYRMANVLHALGRTQDALHCLETAVAKAPGHAQAWHMAGALNGMLERHPAAIECFHKVLAIQPQATESRLNLAQSLLQSEQWEAAVEQCQQVIEQAPGTALAWSMLGRSLAECGRPDDALAAFERALQLQPGLPSALVGTGFTLHQQDRWEESLEYFQQALRANPQLAQAHFGIGSSLLKMGNLQEALRHQQEAARLMPDYAEAQLGVGTAMSMMGSQREAVPYIRKAIDLKPDLIYAYTTLAATLMTLGQPEEAEQLCEQALALEPGNVEAISLATTINQHTGDLEKARERLDPLIKAGTTEVNVALAYSTICSSLDEPETGIAFVEQFLQQQDAITATGRRNLHFNLGKLYDKQKNFEQAFDHYRQGNALKEVAFDPAQQTRETDYLIATHTRALQDTLPHASVRSEQPVFVVGMPRSGTSLVEQILASHPDIFGAGELPDIIQIAESLGTATGTGQGYPLFLQALSQQHVDDAATRYLGHINKLSAGAKRVIDKMPGNFLFLGLIELLFPGARMIHCRRDPLDTCLSCYFQDFSRSHPYSYNLAHLGVFYRNYERIMQHWRDTIRLPMIEVQYEDMIADQETGSRRIVEFCDLPWDDRCLQFHRTDRYVATASYDQVRRPLYKSSVQRWKNYSMHIAPLRTALYPPAGHEANE